MKDRCFGLSTNNGDTYYRCGKDAKHKFHSVSVCTTHYRQLLYHEKHGTIEQEIKRYHSHRGA